MTRKWQLKEARNKFTELVEHAISEGPQIVTKRGNDSVVVISIQDFQKLKRNKDDILSFFENSPRIDVDIERSKDFGKNLE